MRIIKLTENDLTRIVKRVIKENKKLNESFFENEFEGFERQLENIFNYIKENFDPKNLYYKYDRDAYEYVVDDSRVLRVKAKINPLSRYLYHIIFINGNKVDCPEHIADEMWAFFDNKYNEENHLNEAFFGDMFDPDIKKGKKMDRILGDILKDIKEDFNIKNLHKGDKGRSYVYKIDNTGYIKVLDVQFYPTQATKYIVYLGDNEVNCTQSMAKKIYDFFDGRYEYLTR